MSDTQLSKRVRKPLTPAQTIARNDRRRERAAEARKAKTAPKPKPKRKKLKRKTNLKSRKTRKDWNAAIYALQHGPKNKTIQHKCSTPGVAQVTRVRLLAVYDGIEAETKGSTLIISRA